MTSLSGADARRYGTVFDEVADEYDRTRPMYPDALVDRACEVAGLGSGDPVLEIGCGTGQLTRSLVARGLRVTAVEPGGNLIRLAEQNLVGTGTAELVNARFEDAALPIGYFRAVFSASALHWVDPTVGWRKIAGALADGGTLALLSYFGVDEPRSRDDQDAMLAATARMMFAPGAVTCAHSTSSVVSTDQPNWLGSLMSNGGGEPAGVICVNDGLGSPIAASKVCRSEAIVGLP